MTIKINNDDKKDDISKGNVCKDTVIDGDDKNDTSPKGSVFNNKECKIDEIKKDDTSSEGLVFKNKKLEDRIYDAGKYVALSTYFPHRCTVDDEWSKHIILNGLKNHKKKKDSEKTSWQNAMYKESKKNFETIKPHLVKLVAGLLSNRKFLVIPFPSAKQNNTSHGITNFVEDLVAENSKWENGTQFLQRTQDVTAKSSGGNRTLDSTLISVVEEQKIEARNILLIDDVVTSGNSFKVGKELLQKKKAGKVFCLAIGKTWDEYRYFEFADESKALHQILKDSVGQSKKFHEMYLHNLSKTNELLEEKGQ